MKIKEIMSKDIACLNSKDSIEKAAKLMKEYDIGSIPVCDGNRVIGIVTDRDLALRSVASGQDPLHTKISDVMTSAPIVGNPEMDVHDVAKIMSEQQIRRLPIVENNNLVGIVSLGDISLEPILSDNAQEALTDISQPGGNHVQF